MRFPAQMLVAIFSVFSLATAMGVVGSFSVTAAVNGTSVFSAASATASAAAAATIVCSFLTSTAGCFVGKFLGGGGWRAGCSLARGVSSSRSCSH